MQLKIKRSQEMKGVFSKSAHFTLAFRVQFTPEERSLINKYKLGKETIASVKLTDEYEWEITADGAEAGRDIQLKSLRLLQECESQVKAGCEWIKTYLDVAESFDGREIIHDFV